MRSLGIRAGSRASAPPISTGSDAEPAKGLLPYLQRADELQKHESLVAYYCESSLLPPLRGSFEIAADWLSDGDPGHDGDPDRGYGESRGDGGPSLWGFRCHAGVVDGSSDSPPATEAAAAEAVETPAARDPSAPSAAPPVCAPVITTSSAPAGTATPLATPPACAPAINTSSALVATATAEPPASSVTPPSTSPVEAAPADTANVADVPSPSPAAGVVGNHPTDPAPVKDQQLPGPTATPSFPLLESESCSGDAAPVTLPVGELTDEQPSGGVHVAAPASDPLRSPQRNSKSATTPYRGSGTTLSPPSVRVYQRRAQSEAVQRPRRRLGDRVVIPSRLAFEPLGDGAAATGPTWAGPAPTLPPGGPINSRQGNMISTPGPCLLGSGSLFVTPTRPRTTPPSSSRARAIAGDGAAAVSATTANFISSLRQAATCAARGKTLCQEILRYSGGTPAPWQPHRQPAFGRDQLIEESRKRFDKLFAKLLEKKHLAAIRDLFPAAQALSDEELSAAAMQVDADIEIEQKQKYAIWKAAEIRKAIKEGRKPEPGPPGGDKDEAPVITTTILQNHSSPHYTSPDYPTNEVHKPPSNFPPSPYTRTDYPPNDGYNPPSNDRPDVLAYPQTYQPPPYTIEPQHTWSYPSFQDSTSPSVPTHQSSFNPTSDGPASNPSAPTHYHCTADSTPQVTPPAAPLASQYKYDSSYQPAVEKIAEAHKAAKFAVGALAFDDVSVAVDHLKLALDLLANPSAESH
ncbi:hypothetical protein C2845_PM09G10670 [Panicum miliaceum]|uniref:Vta1 C-terminal domain-containing protein n=1 Tax=Panicum miliaceum TaxID=4540 RepID=A0A3L6S3C1_PANMI|nr:hypothetical protein C2845_PM09G10670 [Panicum miliaceum]